MARLSATLAALTVAGVAALYPAQADAKPKIHIAFQWHMHQPVYWPGESVAQSIGASRYSFDLDPIFQSRTGPYTAWPIDAVERGSSLAHLGAQVSFTGSLMDNLNALEGSGRGFSGWKSRWKQSRGLLTAQGNQRLETVLIGYYHPLMPLIPSADRRLHVALHARALERELGATKKPQGIFPPETAFSEAMIPDLAVDGVKWVLVDNIHFDRARTDYPWSKGGSGNLLPPNPADQHDVKGGSYLQLKDLWAGSKVNAAWGYQPHWMVHTDPDTGRLTAVIAVPAARYEGNEDARGGFGALQYEKVLSQLEPQNTDDAHPALVVLHHDGDNYGGGTDSYYHGNFGAFVDWVKSQSDRFEATTVQDYLDRFPPAKDDVIHVEAGSWSGADNGDPQFAKWNAPNKDGYSSDRNSWGVVVAAANRVHTAQAIQPYASLDAITAGNGSPTENAWHHLLIGETSCYWYWDYSEGGKWDSHPARAANLAVAEADKVIGDGSRDAVPPTIFVPQREPYNPGGMEWGTAPERSDFDVWTYVYDVSGLTDVTLHVRVIPNGFVQQANQRYAGGAWQSIPMTAAKIAAKTDPAPKYKADEYRAQVKGVKDALVDYYVSAKDGRGNEARSPLQHVYVGARTGAEPPDAPLTVPDDPSGGPGTNPGTLPGGGGNGGGGGGSSDGCAAAKVAPERGAGLAVLLAAPLALALRRRARRPRTTSAG